jgi:hypothetical protein
MFTDYETQPQPPRALVDAMRDLCDWSLDIAQRLARESEDDVAAIERVRCALHAWIDGEPTEIDLFDLSMTLASIFSNIDDELDRDEEAVS